MDTTIAKNKNIPAYRRRKGYSQAIVTLTDAVNRVGSPRKKPGAHYTSNSYRNAILRACDKAGIDRWHPHQLRHTAATLIRRDFGLEAARIALGHSSALVTDAAVRGRQRRGGRAR